MTDNDHYLRSSSMLVEMYYKSVTSHVIAAILLVSLLIIQSPQRVDAWVKADTWDYCGCSWNPWRSWSSCTSRCYGTQERTRSVRGFFNSKIGCDEFEDCSDIGSEHQMCNKDCNHGTYSPWYPCKCFDGWEGKCCDSVVSCGSPGDIANGRVSVSSYDYGNTVTYSCNTYYNISGYNRQTCSKEGTWSGSKPRCIFVNTCASNPCQNSGTCVDGLDEYTCICRNGYSGIHCEHDIQPPVFTGCPQSFAVNATSATINVTWDVPQASDPHGHSVTVTTNYPLGYAEFPWDDFTVQFVATKPFNGLKSECTFVISVRPIPCPELNVPVNGAKVCNGWKTDMAGLCLVFCKEDLSLPFGCDFRQWWVCGAHGAWIPSGLMPNCSVQPVLDNSVESFNISDYKYSNSSDDDSEIRLMFLNKLQESEFKYFCDKNINLCVPDNVDVQYG